MQEALKFKKDATASVIISLRSSECFKDTESSLNFDCSSAVRLNDDSKFHNDSLSIDAYHDEGESTDTLACLAMRIKEKSIICFWYFLMSR